MVVAVRMSQTFRTGPEREEAQVNLPDGRWYDVRTGDVHAGRTRTDELLGDRSVAILERVDDVAE